MKKDLQRLREADALRENEGIIKLKTANTPPSIADSPARASSPTPTPTPEVQPEKKSTIVHSEGFDMYHHGQGLPQEKREALEKILKEPSEQERRDMEETKTFAKEEERQQLFLLESRRADLVNQIQGISKNEEPPLLLERNDILQSQQKLKEKLAPLIEEERKIEAQQKLIENKEKETNVPAEKQILEKERWKVEDERQKSEKKRWAFEQELSATEATLKSLDEKYKLIIDKQSALRASIAQIDNSLKDVYAGISKRERGKREDYLQKNQPPPTAPGKGGQEKIYTKPVKDPSFAQGFPKTTQTPSTPVTKEVPAPVKEKFKAAVAHEEEQRSKFMEDVEKWANEEEK